jgi:hypothetical protein
MSLHSYQVSLELMREDPPFSAFIMAAMRKADSDNIIKLQLAFPEIWDELTERYWTPGGLIASEGGVKDKI